MASSNNQYFVGLVVFVSLFLAFWNMDRIKYLEEVDTVFNRFKRSKALDAEKKNIELTFEQKMAITKEPVAIPFDITVLKWMSFWALVKTFIAIIVLYILVSIAQLVMSYFHRDEAGQPGQPDNQNSENEDDQSGVLTMCLLDILPMFKGLVVAFVMATVYSHVLASYRENQYSVEAARMHVKIMSFLHLVIFLSIFVYYSMSDHGIF